MKPLSQFPLTKRREIRWVLTDIDDTLTIGGKLPASAYAAMEKLAAAGVRVVPITGRPAGWCDCIARQWPVDGVVGENGALYFRYDDRAKKMTRRYWKTADERKSDRKKLEKLRKTILKTVPGCAAAADQDWRDSDLAIDYCEDVAPLPDEAAARIAALFEAAGAVAKISSIHVNGWFGDFDKLAMTRRFFKEIYGMELEGALDRVAFVGDSPNDSPMFRFFRHSVGVANVRRFLCGMETKPAWIARGAGGRGFAEFARALLAARKNAPGKGR